MPPLDRFPNDPFFKRGPSIHWNACIGTQGDEHSYVIGYMQAAMGLVSAVIDKNQPGKRDTLILPILYNARHAIELALKFCARRLVRAGLVQGPVKTEHKVQPLWQMLTDAKIGDRTLARNIEALKPYIDSITAIDQDGQELRYHRNTDDDPSLGKYSIASLEVIRDSLVPLAEVVDMLLFRTIDFLHDRATGTYTARCSRFDLFEITDMLPPLEQWNAPIFDTARDQIRADFGLSSNEFSKAINVIKTHREAVESDPIVTEVWADITPLARNEWICWVTSAKKDETRRSRIAVGLDKMRKGMRRPCCWAGCPHR